VDCQANGILNASFTGDPNLGGNWLVGGNFDGWRSSSRRCRGGASHGQACYSNFHCPGGICESNGQASIDQVDILDFGVLAAKWLHNYDSDDNGAADGHSSCTSAMGNHADVNGDGRIGLAEVSYILQILSESRQN